MDRTWWSDSLRRGWVGDGNLIAPVAWLFEMAVDSLCLRPKYVLLLNFPCVVMIFSQNQQKRCIATRVYVHMARETMIIKAIFNR